MDFKQTSTGERRYCCPKCGDSKYHLYYNPSKELFHCFRCGFKGKGFPFPYSNLNFVDKNISLTIPKYPTLEEVLPFELKNFIEISMFEYLLKRGLTPEIIHEYRLGWCLAGIVIPIYFENSIRAYQVRRLHSQSPKYIFYGVNGQKVEKSNLLFNYDRVSGGVNTLYLMEGVFDVLVAAPDCAVCTFGKTISTRQKLLLNQIKKKKLVLAYDSDVNPHHLINLADELSVHCPTFIKVLPAGKDPADCGSEFPRLPEVTAFELLVGGAYGHINLG